VLSATLSQFFLVSTSLAYIEDTFFYSGHSWKEPLSLFLSFNLLEAKILKKILVVIYTQLCVETESDTFMDDELRSGEEISLTLLKAIGISKFSLPIWFNRFVGLKQLHLEDCKQL
jgi:hypothetical protein